MFGRRAPAQAGTADAGLPTMTGKTVVRGTDVQSRDAPGVPDNPLLGAAGKAVAEAATAGPGDPEAVSRSRRANPLPGVSEGGNGSAGRVVDPEGHSGRESVEGAAISTSPDESNGAGSNRPASVAVSRSSGRQGRRGHIGPDETFIAALDLGTNNCRLLIAKVEADGFRVVDAFSRIVRLGEGLAATGRLGDAAMQRTIDALRICAGKLRRWRVGHIRCVATEACRRALNCEAFLKRVRRETGLQIETISAEEEAGLALAGCAPLLDAGQPHAIVFDIGGGSTELSWLSISEDRPPALLDWMSLPVGVVTLTERHGGDRIGLERYDDMVSEVQAWFADFDSTHQISTAVRDGRVQMLGTSGTVTTLAGIHMDLPRYNRAVVDGATVTFPALRDISQELAELDFEARAAYPCIGRERADLVVSGCAILEAIRRTWPVDRLRVADRGLREGILLGLCRMLADPAVVGDSGLPAPSPRTPVVRHHTVGNAAGAEDDNPVGDGETAPSPKRRRRRRGRRGRRVNGGSAVQAGPASDRG